MSKSETNRWNLWMYMMIRFRTFTYMHYSDAFDCRFEFVDKKRMFFGGTFVVLYLDRQTWACRDNNHNCHNHQVGGNARTYHMPENKLCEFQFSKWDLFINTFGCFKSKKRNLKSCTSIQCWGNVLECISRSYLLLNLVFRRLKLIYNQIILRSKKNHINVWIKFCNSVWGSSEEQFSGIFSNNKKVKLPN